MTRVEPAVGWPTEVTVTTTEVLLPMSSMAASCAEAVRLATSGLDVDAAQVLGAARSGTSRERRRRGAVVTGQSVNNEVNDLSVCGQRERQVLHEGSVKADKAGLRQNNGAGVSAGVVEAGARLKRASHVGAHGVLL